MQLYLSYNFEGLRDDIITMLAGGRCKVDVGMFTNDLISFKSKDEVLACLAHLGYLAYDTETEEVFIPNKEVRIVFERAVKRGGEFKEVMTSIIEKNPRAYFVFIGPFEQELPEAIKSRSVRLGYRKDFISVLKIVNLFMNPKRSGGSGGATRAMKQGIPVTTLPDSDVASFAGEDFICNDYDEMIKEITSAFES